MRNVGVVGLVFGMLATACTLSPGGSSDGQATPDTGEEPQTVDGGTTTTTAPCGPETATLELTEAPAVDAAGLVALSESVYSCMPGAVVVGALDAETVRFASELAIEDRVPLLLATSASAAAVAGELERLEVDEVVGIDLDPAVEAALGIEVTATAVPAATTTTAPTTTAPTTTLDTTVGGAPEDTAGEESVAEETVAEEPATEEAATEPSTETTIPETSDSETTVPDTTVVGEPEGEAAPEATVPIVELPDLPDATGTDGPVVVYGPDAIVDAYLAAPALLAGGGQAIIADLADVDSLRAEVAGRKTVFLGGEVTPTDQWRVNLATSGNELFGGGTQVFPDRRIIAYYGNPLTFRLGLLGETDPARAVERVTERAALYDAEGLPPALPGFEIIVTVASTQAGDDGDYSNEMDIEVVRPWIDAAMANDVSVILDLQPGRTDFVTQAKIYEEFLRLPNVGLALDPEWRLKPDQRHLRQIGRVSAEEVNAVSDYLVSLVHEENLPQKVLILHQFKEQMLPDRNLIRTPPELAMVVHVDGQGSLGSKYGTWDAMRNAPTSPDQQLWWAWKNFIDEDFPTATPGQVNNVDPLPVIVTYQ